MSLRVYNTLTREKELFESLLPGKVGIYLCGPTVYKSPHIGHMVGPVIFDAIKRYLVYKGFEVTWVVNITDVEDKLINAANSLGTSVAALAEKYTAEYMECLSLLGIDSIDRFPKATDHIGEIVEMCKKLIDRNHAYAADGSVYFDVGSDSDYGKLSHRRVEDMQAGEGETSGKHNPADFALWKAAKPNEPSWDSPWGRGRPGWHIECSAMSMKYLGETFDFHGGGMDLMFPHHENELAQSECATGHPFARFWMHNGLTRVDTKKISGSDAATPEGAAMLARLEARRLIAQHGADLVRYLLLTTHYRRPIDFSDEVITSSRKGLNVFYRLFERMERLLGEPLPPNTPEMEQIASGLMESPAGPLAKEVLGHKMKFMEMMDDDFNTAGAIASLHEMAGAINAFLEQKHVDRDKTSDLVQAAAGGAATLRKLASLLGLLRKDAAKPEQPDAGTVNQLMQLLIQLRQDARVRKDFAVADAIRTGLTAIGITLEDRSDGTIWRRE